MEEDIKYYISRSELEEDFKKGDYLTTLFDTRRCIVKVDHFITKEEGVEPLIVVQYGLNSSDIVMYDTTFGGRNKVRLSTQEEIEYLEEMVKKDKAKSAVDLNDLTASALIKILQEMPSDSKVTFTLDGSYTLSLKSIEDIAHLTDGEYKEVEFYLSHDID